MHRTIVNGRLGVKCIEQRGLATLYTRAFCSYAMGLSEYLHRLARPENVYGCFRVTFALALFIGIVPYSVESTPVGRLRISCFGWINVIVRICLYTVNFFYSSMERRNMMVRLSMTNLSRLTADLEMFNGIFGILLVLIFSLLHREQLVQLLICFDSLEREAFPRVGVNFRQAQTAWQLNGLAAFLLSTLLCFIGYTFNIIFTIRKTYISYSAIISYFSPNIIVCGVCILVSALFMKLRIYINALNEVGLR